MGLGSSKVVAHRPAPAEGRRAANPRGYSIDGGPQAGPARSARSGLARAEGPLDPPEPELDAQPPQALVASIHPQAAGDPSGRHGKLPLAEGGQGQIVELPNGVPIAVFIPAYVQNV